VQCQGQRSAHSGHSANYDDPPRPTHNDRSIRIRFRSPELGAGFPKALHRPMRLFCLELQIEQVAHYLCILDLKPIESSQRLFSVISY
jgi:hypothetical protein